MANEHNTINWASSVMELTTGTKQPIVAGTTTDDISGRLVADTVYHLYWKASDPTKWHTELASIWDTNPASGKIRVATLTGVASGGKVQIRVVPNAAVDGQDGINANQSVNQDSVTGTEISTVGSIATTDTRLKFSTAGTGATGAGSAGNFLRGYTGNSISDTSGRWLDIDGDNQAIYFMDGSEANYILSSMSAAGMKFYSGTSATATDGTTRAHYGGSALTFYNGSGLGAGNELLQLGVGATNGLTLFGSTASTTASPSLIKYNADIGGSWVTHGYHGLYNDGSVDHLITYTPLSKVWMISGNGGSSATIGSTIHFETGEGLAAGWKIHASSDSEGTPIFRNCLFPVNSGTGSGIAGDLNPDGTSDEPYNYIGYHQSDTRDGQGTLTFGPRITATQSYYFNAGSGTAASPSHTFYDDVDTGMYHPSTDTVGISAGGSLVAQFDSSGVTIGGALARTAGVEDMWIPAAAMTPTETAGCADIASVETTAGRPDMRVLDFDASTQEYAQFSVAMPKSWNGSTITAEFYWTTTATDTDACIWAIQGLTVSNDETIDQVYGTAITVTDNVISGAEEVLISPTTSAVTLAGGTPAAGDLAFFQVYRDADDGSDNMAEDARLIGVKIHYTTNAATDA